MSVLPLLSIAKLNLKMPLFSLAKVLRLTIAGILVILLAGCSKSATIDRLPPLAQDPSVRVYFNHNQTRGADYTEPYRQIKRSGDNLEQIVIDTINTARSTVDIAVQEFRLPDIARALVERDRAGVKVRVILENTYSRPFSELSSSEINQLDGRERDRYREFFTLVDRDKNGRLSPSEIEERDALIILRRAGIPIIDDTADGSKGSGLMHHKFAIVDGSTVIVSSANFTTSDFHGDFSRPKTRGNANNLVEITNPAIARLFQAEFNLMWGDGPGGNFDSLFGINKPLRESQTLTIGQTKITVNFSPTSPTIDWDASSNGLIGKTLKTATSFVDLALFVFSEQNLVDILQSRYLNRVEIEALIDPEFAFRNYSEGLDMLGVALSDRCRYEPNNKPWQVPINTVGIPQLPEGDKLHHKFAIVDGDTVITGSHNWSSAANHQNDETLLIIENPLITAHFQREFDRLYNNATLGIPVYLEAKIKEDRQNCPTLSQSLSSENQGIININLATQEQLETLPGIGATLAGRIIEARQQKPFSSLEDLKRVSGIGDSKIQKLEGKITW